MERLKRSAVIHVARFDRAAVLDILTLNRCSSNRGSLEITSPGFNPGVKALSPPPQTFRPIWLRRLLRSIKGVEPNGLTSLTLLLAGVEARVPIDKLADGVEATAAVTGVHYGVLGRGGGQN